MLTKRQNECWQAILRYHKREGCIPTYHELAKALKLKSVATVHKAIGHLIAASYLVRVGKSKLVIVPERMRGLKHCSENHALIWFEEPFCPCCKVLAEVTDRAIEKDLLDTVK